MLEDDGPARGFAAGRTAAWVDVAPGQPVTWDRAVEPECGHAAFNATQVGVGFGPASWRALTSGIPLNGSLAHGTVGSDSLAATAG